MRIDLVLHQTAASGPLLPSRLAQAFELLDKLAGGKGIKATMRGQQLRVAEALSLADAACAGFMLDFGRQGLRVRGVAHGPSAAALEWALHALARVLQGRLHDEAAGVDVAASPDERRGPAIAYIEDYEADVRADRTRRDAGEDCRDGERFLAWLEKEEHLARTPGVDAGEALPMSDAVALYAWLLSSDAIDDVFVSERELSALLSRFRARALP